MTHGWNTSLSFNHVTTFQDCGQACKWISLSLCEPNYICLFSINSRKGMLQHYWRGGRVVECARLEIGCTARYRGFESRPLRHFINIVITSLVWWKKKIPIPNYLYAFRMLAYIPKPVVGIIVAWRRACSRAKKQKSFGRKLLVARILTKRNSENFSFGLVRIAFLLLVLRRRTFFRGKQRRLIAWRKDPAY